MRTVCLVYGVLATGIEHGKPALSVATMIARECLALCGPLGRSSNRHRHRSEARWRANPGLVCLQGDGRHGKAYPPEDYAIRPAARVELARLVCGSSPTDHDPAVRSRELTRAYQSDQPSRSAPSRLQANYSNDSNG